MRSSLFVRGSAALALAAFAATCVFASGAAADEAATPLQMEIPVTVDGSESKLLYTSDVTPEAAARSFLKQQGLDTQINYDTHLRAISLDIRRRLNETVDLAWLDASVAASVAVNLDENRVVEFRVHDGESAQVAAEEFCIRHDISLDNAIPLAASIMRRVAANDAPYLLFQLPVTVDNGTNYLNFYSDRIDQEQAVAEEFLQAVSITPENEAYANMTEIIASNLKVRSELLGQEANFAREHTRTMQQIREQTAIARERARILSGDDARSGKMTLQFGASTDEARALSIKVADKNFDLEFPRDNTTVSVALTFCEHNWDLVQPVMKEELDVDVDQTDCALALNEMMISELVTEAEEYERQQKAQQAASADSAPQQPAAGN